MERTFYLSFSILCAILFQSILTLSEENIDKSSSFSVRQKRVVDKSLNISIPVPIEQVPYIVNILINGRSICGGSILSSNVIITAAHCTSVDNVSYSILSGSACRSTGTPHNITRILHYSRYDKRRVSNDLALLVIDPHIDLINSPNKEITLHTEELPPDAVGTISGWGCTERTENGKVYPRGLRSIQMPIINHENCQTIYGNFSFISDKEICTFDVNEYKSTCTGDSGGPLVFNNKLVGVLAWHKLFDKNYYPDVFMSMTCRRYQYWISSVLAQTRT